jgi:O-antigen/teichoic acid export membrane protein
MVPGVAAYSIAHITTSYFNGQVQRPLINTLVAGISLVLNACLGILLTPHWGLAGAVGAATVAYLVAIAVDLVIFVQFARCPFSEVLIPKASDLRAYATLLSSVWPQKGLPIIGVGVLGRRP